MFESCGISLFVCDTCVQYFAPSVSCFWLCAVSVLSFKSIEYKKLKRKKGARTIRYQRVIGEELLDLDDGILVDNPDFDTNPNRHDFFFWKRPENSWP